MKRIPGIVLALAIALIPLAPQALGAGRPIVVDDGSDCKNADATTISGGVALASPGSTIIVCAGTYHESVTISKDDLTIRAKGAPGDVVLNGNAQALLAGFYILNASGNSIEGFRIEQFHEAGILLDIRVGLAATGNVAFHNLTTNSRAFGILAFSGANGTSIDGNRSFDNPTGIAVQGSSGVTVARNHAFGNTLDLQWDGSGANTFGNNHCNTSAPTGLCEHTEGNGH